MTDLIYFFSASNNTHRSCRSSASRPPADYSASEDGIKALYEDVRQHVIDFLLAQTVLLPSETILPTPKGGANTFRGRAGWAQYAV